MDASVVRQDRTDEGGQTLPKTRKGRQTRARLLDAAAVEFGERGFHEASISTITNRAGVALGTFYVYFESKEAMFRALLDHMGHATRSYITERIANAPDRIAAERIGIEAFLEFTRQNRNLYRIVMEAQFVAEDAYRDYYQTFAAAYRENLRSAADAGQIRPIEDEVEVWALIGMSSFIGLRYAIWDDSRPVSEIADAAMKLIAGGLNPRSRDGEA